MNTAIQSREIAAPPRLAAGSRVSARSPVPYIAFLAVFFLISLPLVNPWVRGDGVGYYAYLRAILIDRNLHFEKDWLGANSSFRQGRVDDSGHLLPDQYAPTGYVQEPFRNRAQDPVGALPVSGSRDRAACRSSWRAHSGQRLLALPICHHGGYHGALWIRRLAPGL